MKIWPLLLVLVAGCASGYPTHEQVRATTLRILSFGSKDGQLCSGTAMSPNTLRTAKHCVDGYTLAFVNGERVKAAKIEYQGADEALITLAEPMFKHWARMGKPPKQGERLRWWGNPKGWPSVYREGVVSAVTSEAVVIDAMVCHGDSGSGLFNAKGEVVGVLVEMQPDQGPCVFALGQL